MSNIFNSFQQKEKEYIGPLKRAESNSLEKRYSDYIKDTEEKLAKSKELLELLKKNPDLERCLSLIAELGR